MSSTTSGYNIGAVARLTGIARERIRIWERRYAAVVPHRDATNNRLYSQDDVDRLILIRRLVDAGHAISQVARLSRAELEARLAAVTPAPLRTAMPERVLLFGPEGTALATELQHWNLGFLAVVADAHEAVAWLARDRADLIVAGYPSLTGPELTTLLQLRRAAPHDAMLVVYRFAPQRLLDQLARVGIRAVKAPLQREFLGAASLPGEGSGERPAAPQEHDYRTRQFSSAELSRLGAQTSAVACECPRHIANLVRDLQAFEDYTLACEAATPADAALHREVYDVIARARALTEDALAIVATEERLLP